jgi:hypothetical protein
MAAARKGQSLNDFVKDCVSNGVSATSQDPGSTPRSGHLRPVIAKSRRSAK